MADFFSGISGYDAGGFGTTAAPAINYGGLENIGGFNAGGFDSMLGTSLGGGLDAVGGVLGGVGNVLGGLFGGGGSTNVGGVVGGLASLQQANAIGREAAAAADPFASQRGQYQTMLQGLMTNPESFALSPAAESQMRLGSENLARSGAAKGYLGSGNILAELQKYGQDVASGDYWKSIQNLQMLSGAATSSPAAASSAISSIFGNQQAAMAQVGAATGGGGGGGGDGGLGDIISIGASLMGMFSDRRLKTDIIHIGTHSSGLPLYSFDYVWGEPSTGVMADEVLAVMPEAISYEHGYMKVNYAMLETATLTGE